MARAHGLHGLALSTIRRAPQCPMIESADGITGIPELGGDTAVGGILQHADFFSAFDFPADFGGKLKLVAAGVDVSRALCFSLDFLLGGGYQIRLVPRARQAAHVRS